FEHLDILAEVPSAAGSRTERKQMSVAARKPQRGQRADPGLHMPYGRVEDGYLDLRYTGCRLLDDFASARGKKLPDHFGGACNVFPLASSRRCNLAQLRHGPIRMRAQEDDTRKKALPAITQIREQA